MEKKSSRLSSTSVDERLSRAMQRRREVCLDVDIFALMFGRGREGGEGEGVKQPSEMTDSGVEERFWAAIWAVGCAPGRFDCDRDSDLHSERISCAEIV